ncbi:MAG: TIM barrel protein [Phycisphaerae bacterium]|nr:TIM barrel protein [Phycisphaerae bacterium]
MLKQSFCYPCFLGDGINLDGLCREAARIGYQGVELWFRDDAFESLVASAKTHGLTIASICGHQSLTVGMNRRQEHDRILTELRESIDIAHRLGIPNLICFSGNRQSDQSDADGLAACAACLERIAGAAEGAGVTLNVELLNSKVDHPGYQCDHTSWGVELCRRVNNPHVKLLFDIYHMQIMDGDIIRSVRDSIGYIGHFHTAGNPGRRDLDGTQELNYPAICRAITETGYDGFVAHEFQPKADPIAALRAAFAVCDVR